MRPGQLSPNELEAAILQRMLDLHPTVVFSIRKLHVLSREYTGVGSFTNFKPRNPKGTGAVRGVLDFPGIIKVSGVPNGLGAHLMMLDGTPDCLEIYAFGDDHWDGVYEGYVLPAP